MAELDDFDEWEDALDNLIEARKRAKRMRRSANAGTNEWNAAEDERKRVTGLIEVHIRNGFEQVNASKRTDQVVDDLNEANAEIQKELNRIKKIAARVNSLSDVVDKAAGVVAKIGSLAL